MRSDRHGSGFALSVGEARETDPALASAADREVETSRRRRGPMYLLQVARWLRRHVWPSERNWRCLGPSHVRADHWQWQNVSIETLWTPKSMGGRLSVWARRDRITSVREDCSADRHPDRNDPPLHIECQSAPSSADQSVRAPPRSGNSVRIHLAIAHAYLYSVAGPRTRTQARSIAILHCVSRAD